MAKRPRRSPASGGDSLNPLGLRLLRLLEQAQPSDNVVFSPWSVVLCLAVAANGAGGATREAIARAVAADRVPEAELNRSLRALRTALQEAGPGVELDLATAVWAVRPAAFAPDFVERVRDAYAAEAGVLEAPGAEAAATINRWVNTNTAGRIPTLVAPSDLSPETRSILTNAVHFKGRWADPFDPRRTEPAPFTLPNGQTREVSMMRRSGQCPYLETSEVQAIELEYGDGRLGMLVVLPREGIALDVSGWKQWVSPSENAAVELSLPRIAAGSTIDLAPSLGRLGLEVAFGPGADFARMGLSGSFISAVKHRAEIEVNEEGTKASASTAMIMGRRLIRSAVMTVDRPFYLAIRDRQSDLLLFLGRIVDPDPAAQRPAATPPPAG